jgi:hypothetical protein
VGLLARRFVGAGRVVWVVPVGERNQPAIETVLGAPLQISEDGTETVVEVRDIDGTKVELKRFKSEERSK